LDIRQLFGEEGRCVDFQIVANTQDQSEEFLMSSISRRSFLLNTGMGGVASFALGALPAWAKPMGLPIGIQLYVVGKPLGEDAPGTLKKLHEIGYREVETAGFGKYSAKEFRILLDDAGLVCPSAHLPLIQPDVEALFDNARILGATYATSSVLRDFKAPSSSGAASTTGAPTKLDLVGLDGFKRTAEKMNEIGAKAKAAGLRYAYHNHNYEFEKLSDGRYGYDILVQETDPKLVYFEIDCGWMIVAGADPVAYMKKYPGRFRMLHIKDFMAVPHPTTDLRGPDRPKGTELGKGFIQYERVFAEGRRAGIEHCFAEEEGPYTVPQLEAAKVDFDFLNSFS
jgi:sugar phosphate isomerase/epimerase